MSLLPGLLPSKHKPAGASLQECTWIPPFLISFCTGLKVDGAIFITWQRYRWLSANFDMQLGHVWIWAMFVYRSRGLFLWMVQPKSRFRNLKRVHGTTQEFASGTFRSVNSKAACWPNTSCQQIVAAALQMRRKWETNPSLCLKYSTWAGLKHLIDLNIAWDCFRACLPGTNRLVILRWFSTLLTFE